MSYSKIIKAKLLQNDEKVIVFHKRTNKDGSHSIIPGEETDYFPHKDLIDQLPGPAHASRTQMRLYQRQDMPEVRKRWMSSTSPVSIFGKNDNGIIISGYRITEDGSSSLNTPKIWFESETNTYYFLEALRDRAGEALVTELLAFLDGTKKGEHKPELLSENDRSTEGDEDTDEDDDEDGEAEETPKPNEAYRRYEKNLPKETEKKTSKVKKNHLGQELSDISIPAK
jgi:hypothetical protein